MKIKRQRGFTLLEMSIAIALMALGVIATLQMRVAQSRVDAARSVAQVYERLNNAAGSYMTLYYDKILSKNKPECGVLPYRVGGTSGVPQIPAADACSIILKDGATRPEVANYLQPTPRELKKLGLLTGGAEVDDDSLPLLTHFSANRDQSLVTKDSNGNPVRNGFAVLIQLVCVGDSLESEAVVTAGGCLSRLYDLRSLVFNLQPYVADGPSAGLLEQLVEAAGGGRTYLSNERYEGRLKDSMGGSADSGLKNPLLQSANSSLGAPYVVAIRNGYGSSGNDVFVRRDGSTTLRGDWNVGNKNVTGIKELGATTANLQTVTVSQGLTAQTVTAIDSVSAEKGVFGKFTENLTNALNATTAYIRDALTVAGTLTVKDLTTLNGGLTVAGETNLNGVTKAQQLRLNTAATLGAPCTPESETIAQVNTQSDAYKNEDLRILACDPTSKTWIRSQRDLKGSIDSLSSSLTSLANNFNAFSRDESQTISWNKVDMDRRYAETLNYTPPPELVALGMTQSDYDYIYAYSNEPMWKPTRWTCPSAALNFPNTYGAAPFKIDAGLTDAEKVKRLQELNASQYVNLSVYPQLKFWKLPPPGTLTMAWPDGMDLARVQLANLPYFQNPPATPEEVYGKTATVGIPYLESAIPTGYDYDVMCLQNRYTGQQLWHVAVTNKSRSINYGNNCQNGFSSRYSRDYYSAWGGGVKWDYYDLKYAYWPCLYGNQKTVNWLADSIAADFKVRVK